VKRLILLRHANRSCADHGLPDFERSLSTRGERDAPRMARACASRHSPRLVLTSRAARPTYAKLVAESVATPMRDRLDATLYPPPEEILTLVRCRRTSSIACSWWATTRGSPRDELLFAGTRARDRDGRHRGRRLHTER